MRNWKALRAWNLWLALLPSCDVLVGCGGGGHGNSGPAVVTSADGLTRSATTSNGVRVSVSVDKSTIKTGDDLTYTFTITNTTNAPVSYVSQADEVEPEEIFGILSGATITNTTDGGQLVYTLGEILVPAGTTSAVASAAPSTLTLAPGASLTNTETIQGRTWNYSLLNDEFIQTPPGVYETRVILGTIAPTIEFDGPQVTVTNGPQATITK